MVRAIRVSLFPEAAVLRVTVYDDPILAVDFELFKLSDLCYGFVAGITF